MSKLTLSEFFTFVALLGKCKLYLAQHMPFIYLLVMIVMMYRFQSNQNKEWKQQLTKCKQILHKIRSDLATDITKIELKNNKILQELKMSNTNASARFDRLILALINNPNPRLPLRSQSFNLFK